MISMNTFITINVGNLAMATGGADKTGIVGKDIALRIKFADVDNVRSGRGGKDRQIILRAINGQGRGFCFFCHGRPFLSAGQHADHATPARSVH